MDLKKTIKDQLRQAETYHTHGLLNEAKETYVRVGQLVKKHQHRIKNKDLLDGILKKIRQIKLEIERIESSPDKVEVPENVQNIIKDKFAFAKEDDARALEGAIALAKFGQYERALKEFRDLIGRTSVKVDSAKNIIRCHVTLDSMDQAVAQYKEWFSGDTFTPAQLEKLRIFLQSILDKKGFKESLPKPEKKAAPRPEAAAEIPEGAEVDVFDGEIIEPEVVEGEIMEDEIQEDEIIDISSVEITLEEGPRKGQTVQYDVSFQSGRVINLLISSNDKELIESLKTGLELKRINFYSPIAMFNGRGVVYSKSRIESGPKQGDYSLDIQIKSIS